MYVCVYVCMYVCMHACMHACMQVTHAGMLRGRQRSTVVLLRLALWQRPENTLHGSHTQ